MCELGRGTPIGAAMWSAAVCFATCALPASGGASALAAPPPPQEATGAALPRARQAASAEREPPASGARRARVERLAAAMRQADEKVREARMALTDSTGLLTVHVGAMVLYADSANAERVREAAERAWPVLDRAFGSAAARIAGAPILLRGARSAAAAGDSSATMVLASSGEPVGMSLSMDRESLRRRLISHGVEVMRAAMPPDLHRWSTTYEGIGGRGETFTRAYEELVTSPSIVARECLLGDIGACRSALALEDTPDPLARWYGEAGRRSIIERRRWQLRPRAPATYDRCIAGDDAACAVVADRLDPGMVPPPLSTASRHALVGVATELGGRAAFSRLIEARHGSLADRLSAAAGVPSDSLVGEWRRRVLAAQPHRSGVPFPGAATMLGWTIFFGLLATRSTRWR